MMQIPLDIYWNIINSQGPMMQNKAIAAPGIQGSSRGYNINPRQRGYENQSTRAPCRGYNCNATPTTTPPCRGYGCTTARPCRGYGCDTTKQTTAPCRGYNCRGNTTTTTTTTTTTST